MPGKQDIAHSGPVAVDTQKSEGEGNLGHPWTSFLDQEVDKNQAESSEEGEHCSVFRTRKTQQTNSKKKKTSRLWIMFLLIYHTMQKSKKYFEFKLKLFN